MFFTFHSFAQNGYSYINSVWQKPGHFSSTSQACDANEKTRSLAMVGFTYLRFIFSVL